MLSRPLALVALASALVAGVRPVRAQPSITASSRTASRADLERLLSSYEQHAASTAYSERTRAKARVQAEAVRRRLREGDFRVGDVLLLRVDGGVSVNDTITVTDGQRIQVPGVRQVDLAGVLRSELLYKLTVEVREVVREATVTVRPLTRVAVFGAVTSPGYYSVPAATTLDQLLSVAGGLDPNAKTDELRLLRGEAVILRASEVFDAIAQGRTLDELDTMDGDILHVGRRAEGWQTANTVQLLMTLVTPIFTFLLLR